MHLIKANQQLVKIRSLQLWSEQKQAYIVGRQDRVWESLLQCTNIAFGRWSVKRSSTAIMNGAICKDQGKIVCCNVKAIWLLLSVGTVHLGVSLALRLQCVCIWINTASQVTFLSKDNGSKTTNNGKLTTNSVKACGLISIPLYSPFGTHCCHS